MLYEFRRGTNAAHIYWFAKIITDDILNYNFQIISIFFKVLTSTGIQP